MNRIFPVLLVLHAFFALPAGAQNPARTIRIEGRRSIVVSAAAVRLTDLADVSSPVVGDDDKVIALKKIEIEASPDAGKETTIAAAKILERLQQEGVKLEEVTYVLPRIISVKRASRLLSVAELESAIKEFFTKSGRDVMVKTIDYRGDMHVLPSTTELELSPFSTARPQDVGFTVLAKGADGAASRFSIKATVDEWLEIPVAKRALTKGNEITHDDLVMARLNLASLPIDAARGNDEVVGLKSSAEIAPGEIFRKNKLVVPPVIAQGSKVVMLYKNGPLEVRATGIAMENGALGQEIRIKNDASKKIVGGKVIRPGLVGVN